jgi:hypothetical protein
MSTKANLVIDQGSTFSVTVDFFDENGDPLDLKGYSAKSQIRKWYTSTAYTDFDTFIDPTAGTITLQLDDVSSGELSAGRYVYDLEITYDSTNVVTRLLEGIITVTPRVTR